MFKKLLHIAPDLGTHHEHERKRKKDKVKRSTIEQNQPRVLPYPKRDLSISDPPSLSSSVINNNENSLNGSNLTSLSEGIFTDLNDKNYITTIPDAVDKSTPPSDNFLINNDNEPVGVETNVTELLPFGDGSNKLYGYENFGNTCYCNSVLQCIYNLPEFRKSILEFPERYPLKNRVRMEEYIPNNPRDYICELLNQDQDSPTRSNASTPSQNTNPTAQTSMLLKGHAVIPEQQQSQQQQQQQSQQLQQQKLVNNVELKDIDKRRRDNRRSFFKDLYKSRSNSVPSNYEKTPLSNNSDFHSDDRNKSNALTTELEGTENVISNIVVTNPNRDPVADRLHSGCKIILVGNPEINKVYSEAYLNVTTWENDLNIETRKKLALLHGPVLNIDHLIYPNQAHHIYNALKDLLECITENKSLTGVISPIEFVKLLKRQNPLFDTTIQQDAHEFLNFLLNQMSEYTKGYKSNYLDGSTPNYENCEQDFVKNYFEGTLLNKIKCLTCDAVVTNEEPFLDFPIEIQTNEAIVIQDVFHNFHQREILGGSNKFFCNECMGLQEAEKTVGFQTLPKILALHLKRFKCNGLTNDKLFNPIHYPLNLKVCSFEGAINKQYELSGLVLHVGASPTHGHYVSICKHEKYGWLLYDDETIESISEETVVKFIGEDNNPTTAYVLFYSEIDESAQVNPNSNNVYNENIEKMISYEKWLRQGNLVEKRRLPLRSREPLSNPAPQRAHSDRKNNVSVKRKSKFLHFMAANI
ncbi:hypothetical protein RNJ44_01005 [Nakaseomyces bracarensis]|uniref:Ubiquitin carboxyl-terminal hydrolase n=1 Tax=Nakaseomyces bracarensis TaxID=273131 RepID=A0ABR4NQW4_9SACH